MAGVTGAPNMVAYSASKAAVIAMAKSAAKDLAPAGIRVKAVSPAFIGPGRMGLPSRCPGRSDSPYFADQPDEVAQQMIAMVPLRRYGTTTEVAGGVHPVV
jgi:NAD(P)-dependent dehydrogenase (short-subunit alcohol dehydrogenase family)